MRTTTEGLAAPVERLGEAMGGLATAAKRHAAAVGEHAQVLERAAEVLRAEACRAEESPAPDEEAVEVLGFHR